jgi:hypothetical protein
MSSNPKSCKVSCLNSLPENKHLDDGVNWHIIELPQTMPKKLVWFEGGETSRVGCILHSLSYFTMCRNSIVDAGNHYDDWLRKNAFESLHVQCVLGKAFLKRRARASAIRATQSRKRWQLSLCFQSWAKGQRADKSYRHSLLQRTCASFCEVLTLNPI